MPHKKRTASGVLGGLAGLVGLSAVAGVLVAATVTPAIAVSGAAASSAITMFDNLPSHLDINKLMLPTTILYKNPDTGEDVVMTQFYDQNRSPVEFDEVAPVMYDAILSSEDPRFYQHGGVDLIGTTRAVLSNAGGGETQGGSSISQQYVKNILIQDCEREADGEGAERDAALQACWVDATTADGNEGIERKLQEMRYAIALEQKYPKNDILLGYLNIANFGGTNYGIDAAAKYYFGGTTAANLTLGQAAALAGMVQNPNTYRIDQPASESNGAPNGVIEADPGQIASLTRLLDEGKITPEQHLAAADGYSQTKVRQLYVLGRMLDDGKITQEQYEAAVAEPITPVITPPTTGCAAAGGAAYFCQYVKNTIQTDPAFGATEEDRMRALRQGGLNVYTTLDIRLQQAAQDVMAEEAPTSLEGWWDASTGRFGASAVNIENTTGKIKAIAQNTIFSEDANVIGDPNYSSLVYAANETYGRSGGFQAGSTFKLFTLLDWLEKGHSLNEVLDGRARIINRVTNSCTGDWVNYARERVSNYANAGGYTGTPMQFTAASLNTGFFAMAAELDLCDIGKMAARLGVSRGNGDPIPMDTLFSVVGSDNVTPIAMAGAYGTVANNGIYCQPTAIERVTDSEGVEQPIPQTSCTQVLDPAVAATAAYALEGVMRNGTGTGANPFDGTDVLGKTGTHEHFQTWMIESSTNISTAVWVGNSIGEGSLASRGVNNIRFQIARTMQETADRFYGGNSFPGPDANLTRRILKDLPSVVGMTIDEAQRVLNDAGFDSVVGDPVDSAEPTNIVAAQDPGAGSVAGGTTVTIHPSNGQGLTVPDVAGQSLNDAKQALRAAGFGNIGDGSCTVDASVGNQPRATGTSPAAGTSVNRNAAIAVNYSSQNCGGGNQGGGNPGGNQGGLPNLPGFPGDDDD